MTGPIVLVCGGRDHVDRTKVFAVLDEIRPRIVVHGACGVDADKPDCDDMCGADRFANTWALHRGQVPRRIYPAHWTTQGRAVGPIRNQRMIATRRGGGAGAGVPRESRHGQHDQAGQECRHTSQRRNLKGAYG